MAQVGRTKGLLRRSKAVTCSPLPYGYWGGGERFSFIFSIRRTVHYLTPRKQLTVLVSTVNIKLHGLTGFNLSIIIRVRYHTHIHTKKSGLSVLLKKQKWVRVCQRVKGCQTWLAKTHKAKLYLLALLPHLLNAKINCSEPCRGAAACPRPQKQLEWERCYYSSKLRRSQITLLG